MKIEIKIPDRTAEIRLFRSLVLWLNDLFPDVTIFYGFPSIYGRGKMRHKSTYKTRRNSVSIIVDGVDAAFFTRVVSPALTAHYSMLKLQRTDLCEIGVVVLNTTVLRRQATQLDGEVLEQECLRLIHALGQEEPPGGFWFVGVTISCDTPA